MDRRRTVVLGGLVLVVLVLVGGAASVRHARAWAEPIAYVPPPGEQTGPVPAPNATWRKDRGTFVGPVALGGGRTGFNDRELVLASGGPPPREVSPESGCGQDIVGVVVEDTPEKVVVQGRAFAGPNEQRSWFDRTEWGCNSMRYSRTMSVQLPEPLAGRPVYDDAEAFEPLVVVDGSTLLVPTWLPDGYALAGEATGTFTYALGPIPGPGVEGGLDAAGLSVSQGPDLALVPSSGGGATPPAVDDVLDQLVASGRSVTVRGARGAIVRDVSFLPIALAWHEDDRWFTVSYRPSGSGGAEAPSDDELLRVAESLRTIGG